MLADLEDEPWSEDEERDYWLAHDAELEEREQWPPCGCPYCFCSIQTEYGEPCDSCRAHAHQG